MHPNKTLFVILATLPWLICCQTAPTNGLRRFYLKTPASVMEQTNFTALYHMMRKGQSWPDPQEKDLKESMLNSMLGSFARDFLSTALPQDLTNPARGNQVTEEELLKTMPDSLKSIKFNVPLKRKRHARSKTQSLFRLWLWSISYCPVQYQWIDMGIYVWPRYMKVGYCPSRPCSFPAGMTCQPSRKDIRVKVLLWFCSRTLRCTWKVYNENITSECSCLCKV